MRATSSQLAHSFRSKSVAVVLRSTLLDKMKFRYLALHDSSILTVESHGQSTIIGSEIHFCCRAEVELVGNTT
jgi:23S rRNA maturation mini-RNase III